MLSKVDQVLAYFARKQAEIKQAKRLKRKIRKANKHGIEATCGPDYLPGLKPVAYWKETIIDGEKVYVDAEGKTFKGTEG